MGLTHQEVNIIHGTECFKFTYQRRRSAINFSILATWNQIGSIIKVKVV